VISVDTSVAHLAGALGKPVILMLKRESGNFWLLQREDSPWYPSMRIARQTDPGNWGSVVRRVLKMLEQP
jgi:ADP-heptose:LPS heptosyltransferase